MTIKEPFKSFNSNSKEKKNNEYYTPKYVLDSLNTIFTYDPATTIEQACRLGIEVFDTIETNGLNQDWNTKATGDIWINPPFTLKKEFIEKAVKTIKSGFAHNIYILIPDKALANKYIYDNLKDMNWTLIIPDGRINFIDKNGIQTKGNYFGSIILKLNTDKRDIIHLKINKEK